MGLNFFKIEKLTVPIPSLPNTLEGAKIVQISDLHYDGIRLSNAFIDSVIKEINYVKPDLIVLTGDFVTDDPNPIYDLAIKLKSLRSRVGTYAVLGNHDTLSPNSKDEIIKALTNVGIQVLWNQIAYPFCLNLALVGLADYWSEDFNPSLVMDALDCEIPRIVLSHNPDSAISLQQWRVDLQLSGHTHGGQIVIPGIGPILRIFDAIRHWIPISIRYKVPKIVDHWEWASGLHRIGNNYLYTNRGLGTYAPGRLFCSPEITVITLVGGKCS